MYASKLQYDMQTPDEKATIVAEKLSAKALAKKQRQAEVEKTTARLAALAKPKATNLKFTESKFYLKNATTKNKKKQKKYSKGLN